MSRITYPAFKHTYPWTEWAEGPQPVVLKPGKHYQISTDHFKISVYRWCQKHDYTATIKSTDKSTTITFSKGRPDANHTNANATTKSSKRSARLPKGPVPKRVPVKSAKSAKSAKSKTAAAKPRATKSAAKSA